MPAARVVAAAGSDRRPPIVLVHGAANCSSVWIFWQERLAHRGWSSWAVDLRGHGATPAVDLAATTMTDYADDVVALAATLPRSPALLGWSMGGLVAMMAASGAHAVGCVALAPSIPVRAVRRDVPLRRGTFGPEVYGITSRDPHDEQSAMPDLDLAERRVALAALCDESQLARDERQAGIVIEHRPRALLVVTGGLDRLWPRSRYEGAPLDADWLEAADASHTGLVLNRRALDTLVPAVCEWLDRRVAGAAPLP